MRWIACFSVLVCSVALAEEKDLCQGYTSYEVAYAECVGEEKPMVIYLGAPWCGACVRAKANVIDSMLADGDFSGCNFCYLELPCDPPETAEEHNAKRVFEASKVKTIPQLLVWSKSGGNFRREHAGFPIVRDTVRRIVDRARAAMGR